MIFDDRNRKEVGAYLDCMQFGSLAVWQFGRSYNINN